MIQAITEASQSISYEAMAKLQQELADVILKDPDVESLSLLHRRRRHQPSRSTPAAS